MHINELKEDTGECGSTGRTATERLGICRQRDLGKVNPPTSTKEVIGTKGLSFPKGTQVKTKTKNFTLKEP